MDQMTNGERKAHIEKRVRSTLDNYASLGRTIDAMTPEQRDQYVHRRVEMDLASGVYIDANLKRHLGIRRALLFHVLMLDMVILVFFSLLMFFVVTHGVLDSRIAIAVTTLLGLLVAVSLYRILRANQHLERIITMMGNYVDRQHQTATLDFLVDRIQLEVEFYSDAK